MVLQEVRKSKRNFNMTTHGFASLVRHVDARVGRQPALPERKADKVRELQRLSLPWGACGDAQAGG